MSGPLNKKKSAHPIEPRPASGADVRDGEEWLTDSSWTQLGLTVRGGKEVGASGLLT